MAEDVVALWAVHALFAPRSAAYSNEGAPSGPAAAHNHIASATHIRGERLPLLTARLIPPAVCLLAGWRTVPGQDRVLRSDFGAAYVFSQGLFWLNGEAIHTRACHVDVQEGQGVVLRLGGRCGGPRAGQRRREGRDHGGARALIQQDSPRCGWVSLNLNLPVT